MQLADKLDVARGFEPSFAFRGHANSHWRIVPTLHRAATNEWTRPLPDAAELLRLEASLLSRFKQQAPHFLSPATLQSTQSDIDWWPIMRHFGVPTRLVDWTLSFWVALYFAASGSPSTDGSIHVLHLHSLVSSMEDGHQDQGKFEPRAFLARSRLPDAPDVLHVIGRSTALLDRMLAQQGCFMSSLNVRTDVETTLANTVGNAAQTASVRFLKLLLPASLKADVVRRLRGMNITAATLFPGMDGIGRALEDVVRNP